MISHVINKHTHNEGAGLIVSFVLEIEVGSGHINQLLLFSGLRLQQLCYYMSVCVRIRNSWSVYTIYGKAKACRPTDDLDSDTECQKIRKGHFMYPFPKACRNDMPLLMNASIPFQVSPLQSWAKAAQESISPCLSFNP